MLIISDDIDIGIKQKKGSKTLFFSKILFHRMLQRIKKRHIHPTLKRMWRTMLILTYNNSNLHIFQLLKDGTYISKAKNSKLTYGAMLLVRAVLTRFVSQSLAEASTIAIRYSAIRKQSEIKPG
jgi:hypothetical protein